MATIFRPPLVTRQPTPAWRDYSYSYNGTFRLPTPAAVFPVARWNEWPNPRGPQSAVTQLTWLWDRTRFGPGIVPSPFFQTDWPLPVTIPSTARSIELLTWIRERSIIPTPAAVFPVARLLDQPNPIRVIPAALTWTQGLLSDRPAAVTRPFGQTDWPNPLGSSTNVHRGYAPPSLLGTLLAPVTLGPLGVRSLPYDWPVPRGAASMVARIAIDQNLTIRIVPPAATGYDFWHYYSP